MVEYITKAEMRGFAFSQSAGEQEAFKRAARTRSPVGATFLSHSSKDDELVAGAITILRNHGALVYIDSKDPTMPPTTSHITASKLKERIQQSGRFVLLATENSRESKWVPWELGAADGFKGVPNIAIFPAVESRSDFAWTKWEYMGLYRRIVWGRHKDYQKDIWMVLDHHNNTATELRRWLTR